jgi:Domain of unknown function (DUF4384)
MNSRLTAGRRSGLLSTLGMTTAIGLAFTFMSPAGAQEIAAPADPVAKAAFEALDKHCARCHQDGKLAGGRERPAKNFGFVLDFEKLQHNPKFVLPGNSSGSLLFRQIVDKEMPYDVIYEGAGPDMTAEEITAVAKWIDSLGTPRLAEAPSAPPAAAAPPPAAAAPPADPPAAAAPPAAGAPPAPPAAVPPPAAVAPPAATGAPAPVAVAGCKLITQEDVISLIAADLNTITPRNRRIGTRYLILTNLKNACIDEKSLNVFRQGAIKLVNSLSRATDVVRLEPIDPDGTILRINLDDLGWTDKDWNDILATYPYRVQPDSQLVSVLEAGTSTKMPYVRADWFAFSASRPGLYNKLLKLPKTFQALAKEQDVDVDNNIKKFLAQRAGFQKSGVSRNNRLIERHQSRNGYFWTSYDFAGNKGEQSLFEHPLGPSGKDAFKHDGGETIYSLPNGFQAYYLNKANGEELDKGPTDIVQDPSRRDLQVTNGISCMGCHEYGMKFAKDEVRAAVLAGRDFDKQTRETVDALYPPIEKMDKVLKDDADRFASAMKRAGLDPNLKLGGVEMINALSDRYEGNVDLVAAAGELGLSPDQFRDAATGSDTKALKTLVRRLAQKSAVPRDQFEANYVDLAKAITDQEEIKVAGAAAAAAKTEIAKVEKAIDLSLSADKAAYKQNELLVLSALSPKDCFLTVTSVDEKGAGTVLFPNKFVQDNRIKANVELQLPQRGAGFQYRLQDKGTETVTAVCSDTKEADGIKHDFSKDAFTAVPDYTRSVARTRAIAVEQNKVAPPATPAPTPAPKAAAAPAPAKKELFRTAIQIKVN